MSIPVTINLFIFYSYQNYSSVRFTINLSSTTCKSVHINVCRVYHFFIMGSSTSIYKRYFPDILEIDRHSATIIVNADKYKCVVVQLSKDPLNLEEELYIRFPMCVSYIKIRRHNYSSNLYNLNIQGYLAGYHQYPFHTTQPYENVIVSSLDVLDHKEKDVHLLELKHGLKYAYNKSSHHFRYKDTEDSIKQFQVMTNSKPFLRLKEGKCPLHFWMKFFTKLPTSDKSTTLEFSVFGDHSWMDIYFGPSKEQNVSVDMSCLDSFYLGRETQKLKKVFSKKILELKISKDYHLTKGNLFSLEIQVFTEVKLFNQCRFYENISN